MGGKKSQTVGYRYFAGVHFVICHGPIDAVKAIYVDDKLLWVPASDNGPGRGLIDNYETIHVDAPDLFGGEDREGGISGDIDLGMGHPEQPKNSYLQAIFKDKLVPAYRGVVSVVLKHLYLGTNPYLKPWKFRVQRIWAPTATNKPQWAPAVAGIGEQGQPIQSLTSDEMNKYSAFAPFSFMVGTKHYQLACLRPDKPEIQQVSSRSRLYLVTSDFEKGTSQPTRTPLAGFFFPQYPPLVKQAPTADYRIDPLTRDFKVLEDGRVLFPLCIAMSGPPNALVFDYHYAAIFDPVTKAVTHIRYPNDPVMSEQRYYAPPFNTGFLHRQILGTRSAGAWDDAQSRYVVLGANDKSYELDPLAGTVTPLDRGLNLPANTFVMASAKINDIHLFTLVYATLNISGVWHDFIYAVTNDIRTGASFWSSANMQLPPSVHIRDMASEIAICAPGDGYTYCILPQYWRSLIAGGKRFMQYHTSGPLNGTPVTITDMGLPPAPYGQQLYHGMTERPVKASDGRSYLFPASMVEPGYIFTPGKEAPAQPGTVVQMNWQVAAQNLFTRGTIWPLMIRWHGYPVAFCERYFRDDVYPDSQNIIYTMTDSDGGYSKKMPPPAFDMNPIHIIRECMTNTEWGRGLPESIIGPTFAEAANTLYEEGLGLSMLWTSEMAVNDFILEVIRHIDAARYEDPETGLQEIKLIRPDYDVATLPVLNPSNCRLEQLTEPMLYDLVNQVTVNYWNRDTGADSALAVQDTAAINMVGTINNQTMEYSGITNDRVALMVGQRDLSRMSKPFRSGRLIVNRKVANIKVGDVFVLNWPDRGVDRLVCRAARRSDNGELDGMIGIEFGEDVFGEEYRVASVPPPSGWEDPVPPPVNFDQVTAYDEPYPMLVERLGEDAAVAMRNDSSHFMFAGGRPGTGSHIDYGFFTYPAGTTPVTDPQAEWDAEFTPTAILGEALEEITDAQITVPVSLPRGMSGVRAGDWVLVGNAQDRQREVMAIAETPGSDPVELVLTRAVADTYPRAVPAGTVLYVVGTFTGVDTTERTDGEDVGSYGRPKNGKGAYQGPFTYLEVEMLGRQGRPYPAAAFKVDGSYTPSLATPAESVTLTWAHRHRVQQGNQPISWLADSGYGLEAGVTYQVRQVALDEQQAEIADLPVLPVGAADRLDLDLIDQPYPDAARYARITVEAVRGGTVSLQNRPVTVKLATRVKAPYDLTSGYVVEASAPYDLEAGYYLDTGAPYALAAGYRADTAAPYGLAAGYLPDLAAPYDLAAGYLPDLVAPYGLAAGFAQEVVAPYGLTASFTPDTAAPRDLAAGYLPDLVSPYGLTAGYLADTTAPYGLAAGYSVSDPVAPYGLTAGYLPDLAAPYGLTAGYLPDLAAPYGLTAGYLPDLVSPYGLTAGYLPDLVSPYGLTAGYLPDLVSPYGLTAGYLPDLVSPYGLTAGYLPDLAAPYGMTAAFLPDTVAPYGLKGVFLPDTMAVYGLKTDYKTE